MEYINAAGIELSKIDLNKPETLKEIFDKTCEEMSKHEHDDVRHTSIWLKEFSHALANSLEKSKIAHLTISDQIQSMCNSIGQLMGVVALQLSGDKQETLLGSAMMVKLITEVFTTSIADALNEPTFALSHYEKNRKNDGKTIGFLPASKTVH